ncbi:hypothetical protein [Synechococcus sp. BS55D]|uniref:hypothetical protein n=1 Tax=Synechococcus sp. BS55D TaxID=2055943 RepID=UPI00103F06E8|nr:hypothetical protein [Synechococcus sp. BS55D]TCD56344.1 hypothetical protein CWE16_08100 [Synechococcus sp. BS55D]
MRRSTGHALLSAALIAGVGSAIAYQASGYLIGAIYGGSMRAHRLSAESNVRSVKEPIKPDEWAGDNVYLGRWKANSTAGRAVVNILTVEPTRLRWGTPLNGICDSDYSVEILPWGRNGTFPDQLVPPSEPSDLVVGVARLTLFPKPCHTGDAVVQLAIPLDGSNRMAMNTYDRNGKLTAQYPDLTLIR